MVISHSGVDAHWWGFSVSLLARRFFNGNTRSDWWISRCWGGCCGILAHFAVCGPRGCHLVVPGSASTRHGSEISAIFNSSNAACIDSILSIGLMFVGATFRVTFVREFAMSEKFFMNFR